MIYNDNEEGLYDIKRVVKLPKKGNANYLYTVKSEVFKRLYRWQADKTWEIIDLQQSIGGTDELAYLEAGTSITITGAGSFANPYIISSPYQSAQNTQINNITGISSSHVQGALEEMKTSITNIENTYVVPDGSETVVQDGSNVLVTGSGTSGNPYIVSSPFQNALNTSISAIAGMSATEVQGALAELKASEGGDGSETIVQGSGDIDVTGTGTSGDPYIVGYDANIPVPTIRTVKVPLTAGQLLNLASSPITAVASPGVGQALEVFTAFIKLNFNGTPLDIPASGSGSIAILCSGATIDAAQYLGDHLMLNTSSSITTMLFRKFASQNHSIIDNRALIIGGLSNGTSGNTTAEVHITYRIVDL